MDATLTTLDRERLRQLFATRYADLQALDHAIAHMPPSPEARFHRRLVARALYSTWADLQALRAAGG